MLCEIVPPETHIALHAVGYPTISQSSYLMGSWDNNGLTGATVSRVEIEASFVRCVPVMWSCMPRGAASLKLQKCYGKWLA